MSRPSLLNLETALWVARLGGFSAAARKLNATQPAVALRIRELESALGERLFERRGRTMQATAQGREFLQRIEPLLGGIQDALADFEAPGHERGVVRIGSGNIPMAWTSALIARLQQQMPAVTYELEIGFAGPLLAQLRDGVLDLVIVAGSTPQTGFDSVPLGATRMHWVAAADRWARYGSGPQPPSLGALLDHGPIWLVPRSSPYFPSQLDTLMTAGAHCRNICSCDNMAALIQLVSDGGGVGYLPEVLIAPQLAGASLLPLFADAPAAFAQYTLVYQRARLSPLVRRIVRQAAGMPTGSELGAHASGPG